MKSELTLTKSTSCRCGERNEGDPVLDARSIPHEIRHAAIFGALDSLKPGKAIELVAAHDPLPLLAQIEKRYPDSFEISYLVEGPHEWRLRLARC